MASTKITLKILPFKNPSGAIAFRVSGMILGTKRLGVAPVECIVLEDSLVGVQAARAAGMTCYAVPSLEAEAPQIATVANRTFPSLVEVASAIGGITRESKLKAP